MMNLLEVETVDLSFPVRGNDTLPADHGYALLGALSRRLPDLHGSNGVGVHPIGGRIVGHRRLCLAPWSDLRIRLSTESIPVWIKLAGQQLNVDGMLIRLGVPRVFALSCAEKLTCRLATIKGFCEPVLFGEAVQRQLDHLGISGEVVVQVEQRRTLRVKDREIVGFGLSLTGLAPHESLAVQIAGVGGRRHMGCGILRPSKARHSTRGANE